MRNHSHHTPFLHSLNAWFVCSVRHKWRDHWMYNVHVMHYYILYEYGQTETTETYIDSVLINNKTKQKKLRRFASTLPWMVKFVLMVFVFFISFHLYSLLAVFGLQQEIFHFFSQFFCIRLDIPVSPKHSCCRFYQFLPHKTHTLRPHYMRRTTFFLFLLLLRIIALRLSTVATLTNRVEKCRVCTVHSAYAHNLMHGKIKIWTAIVSFSLICCILFLRQQTQILNNMK